MNVSAERVPMLNASSLVLLGLTAAIFFRPPGDLDFCWQIRTGEKILATGQVRQPDTFSYTIAGKDLPDHEWLYETLLALVWKHFGHGGLKLVRACLYVLPLLILTRQLRRRGVPDYSAVWFILLAAFVLFWFERLRPLVCTTICLQLVAGWLSDWSRGRRLDWKLPLTMLLWGNLHPAVIYGQFLILGVLIWEWFAHLRGNSPAQVVEKDGQVAQWPRTKMGNLTFWGLAAVGASLICPAPINRLTYPFAPELRHSAQRIFAEIKPPWQYLWPPQGMFTVIAGLWLVLAVIFTILMLRRYRNFRVWEWALYVCLLGLAFTATRAIGDWLVVTLALVVPQFGPWLKEKATVSHGRGGARLLLAIDRRAKRVGRGWLFRLQSFWWVLGLGFLAIIALAVPEDRLPNNEHGSWPKGAADWMSTHSLPTPRPWKVFSGFNEGAYLIWRSEIQAKVYSDTRGFFYPGELLEDSYYLPLAAPGWEERLDRVLNIYGTEYFLLPVGEPGHSLWLLLEPFIPAPFYRDDKFVLLSADQVRAAWAKLRAK
jgi:hypothetical protein